MAEFGIETHSRNEIIDVTSEINARIPKQLACGICYIFCPHTTAGITINENADPDVKRDILTKLDRLMPHDEAFYRHSEGNSAAHLKAILTGFSLAVPVRSGSLLLGTWQSIYFCEYDGPRFRKLRLTFQAASE